jgi:hypothetical protein
MKRFLTPAVAAALLVGAGAAWSAGGDDGPKQDRLAGGGVFGPGCSDGPTPFCPPRSREFSIDAASNPEGGRAYGRFLYGVPDTGTTLLRGRITCLNVDGNAAVAGGWLVDAAAGAPDVFFVYMKDNGDAGSFVRDRSSPALLDFSDGPDLPARFPRECPPADAVASGTGYFTLTGGDVQITDE